MAGEVCHSRQMAASTCETALEAVLWPLMVNDQHPL